MRERDSFSLSAEGRAEKPSVEKKVRLSGHPHPETGEMLYSPAVLLIFPGVVLSELHSLGAVVGGSADATGTLRLFVRLSHLEEFHRELGEFLAKRGQSSEPPAT